MLQIPLKEYRHYVETFSRFISAVETTRNEEDFATDKYGLLVNFLGSEVCAYVEKKHEL